MAKAKRPKPLAVGDKVVIEKISILGVKQDNTREYHEYTIVRANSSSAYAQRESEHGVVEYRIHQKDRLIGDPFGWVYHYNLWESKEQAEEYYRTKEYRQELIDRAKDKIQTMTISELEEALGINKEEK